MYARALLGWLHAEYLLPRDKRYASRRGEKDRRIHVSTNRNQLKKEHTGAESTGQKLSGAFRSYPHLGHGLSQRQILVKRLNVNRIKAGSAKFELLYSKKNAL